MVYVSTKEIAEQWGITSARASTICASGQVPGAYKKGKMWMIPENVERPIDKRVNAEKKEDYKFTFVDLFAGIGGFHQAMRFLGGKCIMASEINAACVETYKLNYKTKDVRGDIKKIEADSIGEFDLNHVQVFHVNHLVRPDIKRDLKKKGQFVFQHYENT